MLLSAKASSSFPSVLLSKLLDDHFLNHNERTTQMYGMTYMKVAHVVEPLKTYG